MKAERKLFQATLGRVAECFDTEHKAEGKKLLQELYSQFQKAHPTIVQVDPAEVATSQLESAKREFDESVTLLERRIKELEHQLAAEKSGRQLDRQKERSNLDLETAVGFSVSALSDVVASGFDAEKCAFGYEDDFLMLEIDGKHGKGGMEYDVQRHELKITENYRRLGGEHAVRFLQTIGLYMSAHLTIAQKYDDVRRTAEKAWQEFQQTLRMMRTKRKPK